MDIVVNFEKDMFVELKNIESPDEAINYIEAVAEGIDESFSHVYNIAKKAEELSRDLDKAFEEENIEHYGVSGQTRGKYRI